MDHLTSTVAAAIRTTPGSLRELAAIAGVSHVQLHRVLHGQRRASAAVAAKVAAALETWSERAARSAQAIRAARRGRRRVAIVPRAPTVPLVET